MTFLALNFYTRPVFLRHWGCPVTAHIPDSCQSLALVPPSVLPRPIVRRVTFLNSLNASWLLPLVFSKSISVVTRWLTNHHHYLPFSPTFLRSKCDIFRFLITALLFMISACIYLQRHLYFYRRTQCNFCTLHFLICSWNGTTLSPCDYFKQLSTIVDIGQFLCAEIYLKCNVLANFIVWKLFDENECDKKQPKINHNSSVSLPKLVLWMKVYKSSAYLFPHTVKFSLTIVCNEITPFCCYETIHFW